MVRSDVWASADWRTTGVFNYNNDIPVEMRLLYGCRIAFMGGTLITSLLEDTLDPLRSDPSWTQEEPRPGQQVSLHVSPRRLRIKNLKDKRRTFVDATGPLPSTPRTWS